MDRKRRRVFQRVMSGMKVGGNLKLVTLTTSEEAWNSGLDIQESWRKLYHRLRRRGLTSGYVRVKEYTKAGLPHLHMVIRGPWIAQGWLSDQWKEIHQSPIVDVRRARGKGGAAAYLSKYLGEDPRAKYSWSWEWVWRGFVKDWKQHIVDGFDEGYSMGDIISMWDAILERFGERRRARVSGRTAVCFGGG